jgi:alpha-glucoside transport system substrate-binding protein
MAAALAVVALAAVLGVESPAAHSAPQTRADQPALPPASVKAAEQAARAIVHGKKVGGTVDLLGVVTGAQANTVLAALKPFEAATGINVNYEATFSQQSILQTRIQGGNPPDVVLSSFPVQLIDLAKAGKLVPLNNVVNLRTVQQQYPKALLDLGTVNGKLYGFFSQVNYHGLIWFNREAYNGPRSPANWAQLAAWTSSAASQGKTPWCLGIESGAATGWPATNEIIQELFVRRYGPKLATQWESGKLLWTSPQVRWAWHAFGSIFTDPKMVAGGPTAVASTNFLAAGNGMFTAPPSCDLLSQAQWYGSYAPAGVQGATAANTSYFPFPAIKPAYAKIQMVDGNQVALIRNRPQGRALAAYMSTSQFETLVAEGGQLLVPNTAVRPSAYPTPLSKKLAAELVASKTALENTIVLPSNLFPLAVTNEFWKDVTSYIQNPSNLDSYLNDMASVAKSAK